MKMKEKGRKGGKILIRISTVKKDFDNRDSCFKAHLVVHILCLPQTRTAIIMLKCKTCLSRLCSTKKKDKTSSCFSYQQQQMKDAKHYNIFHQNPPFKACKWAIFSLQNLS
ncbi:hypothetical protein V6Z11_D06G151900 [Gossypium hirsutum]